MRYKIMNERMVGVEMKKVICFLISVFVCLNSPAESKDIEQNFVVSGLGGRNYFGYGHRGLLWGTGWGESYGLKAEFDLILKQVDVSIGLECGSIYEIAVAEEAELNITWIRKVIRTPLLVKFTLFPSQKISLWIGIGYENYNTIYARAKYEFEGIWYETRIEQAEGIEIFQTIAAGLNINIGKNFILSPEVRFGVNQTNNTIKTVSYESWQFLLGLGYRLKLSK